MIFAAFSCDTFDDQSRYLNADQSIDCDTDESAVMRWAATIMIVVYPICVPCLYLEVIRRHWPQLRMVRHTGDTRHRRRQPSMPPRTASVPADFRCRARPWSR